MNHLNEIGLTLRLLGMSEIRISAKNWTIFQEKLQNSSLVGIEDIFGCLESVQ